MSTGWRDPKSEITVDWGFMEKAPSSIKTDWESDQIFTTPGELHKFTGEKFAPQNYQAKVHELSTEQLIAISAQRSKGFQIIEVIPRLLQPDEYSCSIPLDEIISTIGSSSPLSTLQDLYKYFKSVEFPVVGNYLKFEILPPKYELNDLTPYQNNKFAQDGGLTLHYQDYYFLNLIDTSGKSFKLKHGDVIRSYFDNLILTFPATGARFRITIGFNSEYIGKDYRAETLYIGDSPQVQSEQNYLKPTPFCISNTNSNDSAFTVNDGATGAAAIIRNYVNSVTPVNSNNVFWITHLSVLLATTNTGAENVSGRFGLDIKDGSANRVRRLHQTEFGVVTINGTVFNEYNFHFSQPLRAQLIGVLQLYFYLTLDSVGSNPQTRIRFSINGYGTSPLEFLNPLAPAIPAATIFRSDTPIYEIDTMIRAVGV